MRPAFHNDATIFGYIGSELFAGSIQQLFDWNDSNGPATGLEAQFASIDDAARLNIDQLLSRYDRDSHIYVCGPVRMIQSVRNLANKYSWDPDQIHFESFGTQPDPEDKAVTARLSRSRKTIPVKPPQTILDALTDAGIPVPHDCKRGGVRDVLDRRYRRKSGSPGPVSEY